MEIKLKHKLEYELNLKQGCGGNVGNLKSGERTLKAATNARQHKTSFSKNLQFCMGLDGGEVFSLVGEFKNKTGLTLQRWQSQELKRALKAASDQCQAAKDLVPSIISNLAWTWME